MCRRERSGSTKRSSVFRLAIICCAVSIPSSFHWPSPSSSAWGGCGPTDRPWSARRSELGAGPAACHHSPHMVMAALAGTGPGSLGRIRSRTADVSPELRAWSPVDGAWRQPRPGSGTPPRRRRVRAHMAHRREPSLLAMLVLLSVFWTITLVAESRGLALADQVEAGIDLRPAVVVHSQRPLGFEAPGVTRGAARGRQLPLRRAAAPAPSRGHAICSCTTDGPGKRACS